MEARKGSVFIHSPELAQQVIFRPGPDAEGIPLQIPAKLGVLDEVHKVLGIVSHPVLEEQVGIEDCLVVPVPISGERIARNIVTAGGEAHDAVGRQREKGIVGGRIHEQVFVRQI